MGTAGLSTGDPSKGWQGQELPRAATKQLVAEADLGPSQWYQWYHPGLHCWASCGLKHGRNGSIPTYG